MLNVLCSKHLKECPAADASFNSYMVAPPEIVPLYIMANTVIEVVQQLSSGAGTGVTGVVILHN